MGKGILYRQVVLRGFDFDSTVLHAVNRWVDGMKRYRSMRVDILQSDCAGTTWCLVSECSKSSLMSSPISTH